MRIFRRGEYTTECDCAQRDGGQARIVNQENVIAFLRRDPASGRSVLAVLPRFACTLMRGKAELPLGRAWGKDQFALPIRGHPVRAMFLRASPSL